jgi:hypothetical protein
MMATAWADDVAISNLKVSIQSTQSVHITRITTSIENVHC